MWGKTGRGSPSRKSAYQSFLDSSVAPKHAKFFEDAESSYAEVGHPYKNANSSQVLDIFNRELDLVVRGTKSSKDALQTMQQEADPVRGIDHEVAFGSRYVPDVGLEERIDVGLDQSRDAAAGVLQPASGKIIAVHEGGAIGVPEGPGLGVRLDREKLARYHALYQELGGYPYDRDPQRPDWYPLLPNTRWAAP